MTRSVSPCRRLIGDRQMRPTRGRKYPSRGTPVAVRVRAQRPRLDGRELRMSISRDSLAIVAISVVTCWLSPAAFAQRAPDFDRVTPPRDPTAGRLVWRIDRPDPRR